MTKVILKFLFFWLIFQCGISLKDSETSVRHSEKDYLKYFETLGSTLFDDPDRFYGLVHFIWTKSLQINPNISVSHVIDLLSRAHFSTHHFQSFQKNFQSLFGIDFFLKAKNPIKSYKKNVVKFLQDFYCWEQSKEKIRYLWMVHFELAPNASSSSTNITFLRIFDQEMLQPYLDLIRFEKLRRIQNKDFESLRKTLRHSSELSNNFFLQLLIGGMDSIENENFDSKPTNTKVKMLDNFLNFFDEIFSKKQIESVVKYCASRWIETCKREFRIRTQLNRSIVTDEWLRAMIKIRQNNRNQNEARILTISDLRYQKANAKDTDLLLKAILDALVQFVLTKTSKTVTVTIIEDDETTTIDSKYFFTQLYNKFLFNCMAKLILEMSAKKGKLTVTRKAAQKLADVKWYAMELVVAATAIYIPKILNKLRHNRQMRKKLAKSSSISAMLNSSTTAMATTISAKMFNLLTLSTLTIIGSLVLCCFLLQYIFGRHNRGRLSKSLIESTTGIPSDDVHIYMNRE